MSKHDIGKALHILNEPTTNPHFTDIQQLFGVLYRLYGRGNTMVVVKCNLDVTETADWLVGLGPEGGSRDGQVTANGTPGQVAKMPQLHIGRFLKPLLKCDRA